MAEETHSKIFTIRWTESQYEELKNYADEQDLSVGEFVRDVVMVRLHELVSA